MRAEPDSIELADVVRALQRGWRAVAGWTLLGILAAAAVVFFAPRRFEGRATIVVRANDPSASILSRLGAGMGDAASVITGGKTQLETEIQILESRAIAEQVVDSLLLQARVKSPASTPVTRLLSAVSLPGSFKKKTVSFNHESNGSFRVRGAGVDTVVPAGGTVALLGGSVTIAPGVDRDFRLQFLDREDAITLFDKRLGVGKAGGEVASISYSGDDSLTAAAATNAVIAEYLVRRRVTDRNLNTHRVEFLTAQLDSTGRALSASERELRRYQEQTGVLDPTVLGRVGLERAKDLRGQLTQVQVEEGAINQLLTQVEKGTLDTRQLMAYPAFLRSAGLNEMVAQLNRLESERQRLLERRTDNDPEVVAISKSIASLEGQFVPMARSYSSTLSRQRTELDRELDSLRTELGVLPGAAESSNRLQRDVLRLGTVYGALQAQLVEARLAAIGEGGDVRQLDAAFPSKKPSFPKPGLTFGIGGAAGLAIGLVAALVLAAFGRWARDPREIERTTGVPTLIFERRAPLVVANGMLRTVLVIPLHQRADTLAVATQLVETSLSRGSRATLLDLSAKPIVASENGASVATAVAAPIRVDVASTISRLSAEFDHVVVRLPELGSDATLSALNSERTVVFVVPPERVEREQLAAAMQLLRRLDVPCAGVVISGSAPSGRLRALVG